MRGIRDGYHARGEIVLTSPRNASVRTSRPQRRNLRSQKSAASSDDPVVSVCQSRNSSPESPFRLNLRGDCSLECSL